MSDVTVGRRMSPYDTIHSTSLQFFVLSPFFGCVPVGAEA